MKNLSLFDTTNYIINILDYKKQLAMVNIMVEKKTKIS